MSNLELDEGISNEYKIEAICNSEVYFKKSDSGQRLGLDCVVL